MGAKKPSFTADDLSDALALSEALLEELSEEDWPKCEKCGTVLEQVDIEDGVVQFACPEHEWHDVHKPVANLNKIITEAAGDISPLRVIARPVIRLVGPDHARQVPDAVRSLARYGTVYRHANGLATVEPASGAVHALNATGIRTQLARLISWTRHEENGHVAEVAAPRDMGGLVLNSPHEWGQLPQLDTVTRVPVLAPDGRLLTRPGYDTTTRTFYAPDPGLGPANGDMAVTDAVALVDELFRDFPFVGVADRAHAIGLLLLPFVRPAIEGPTPLHWVDAPASRTGKGLLVRCALLPGHGDPPQLTPWPARDDELRKEILAKLRAGSPAFNFDNVRGRVTSAVLEAALTAEGWDDRRLGFSEMVSGRITQVWTLTANNGAFGGDLAGRVVPIRLDAKTEDPSARTGFHHPLPGWARERRVELVSAALSLVKAWVAAGRPDPADDVPAIGGFEEWRRTVGGILKIAGIDGLLANRQSFRADRDDEAAEQRQFWSAMHREFGDAWFEASDACGRLPNAGSDTRQVTERWLKPNKGKVIDGLMLEYGRVGGVGKWRLVPV